MKEKNEIRQGDSNRCGCYYPDVKVCYSVDYSLRIVHKTVDD